MTFIHFYTYMLFFIQGGLELIKTRASFTGNLPKFELIHGQVLMSFRKGLITGGQGCSKLYINIGLGLKGPKRSLMYLFGRCLGFMIQF